MGKIQRYDQSIYELGGDLYEDPKGEYIRYSDHEREVKSLKQLLKVKDAGMKALQTKIEKLQEIRNNHGR